MNFIIRILITALGIFIGARYLTGVTSKNYGASVIVALVVAFLSVTLGVFLKVITLGLFAYGIFALVLDAILFLIADWFLEDFNVKNFWWALALAAIVALINIVLTSIVF